MAVLLRQQEASQREEGEDLKLEVWWRNATSECLKKLIIFCEISLQHQNPKFVCKSCLLELKFFVGSETDLIDLPPRDKAIIWRAISTPSRLPLRIVSQSRVR